MDIAILSATVLTGNPNQPRVEALGIANNRIVIVGSNEAVKERITDNTQVFEMPGRLITPGLVDAHLHFLSFGMSLCPW